MSEKELFKRIVGKCIRDKRRSKGFSQEELAAEIDMTNKHISNIERAIKCPSSYTLARIQLVLDINSDDFLREFDEKRLKEE